MEIQYIGEHLLPGKIGHFFVLLSFCSALLAFFSWSSASNTRTEIDSNAWKRLGRWSFGIHAIAVAGIVGVLYYLIFNDFFEYYYVWQHSSVKLPWYYRLSCFWEGQEGSFLLWSIWHSLIGLILMFSLRKWEAPVMAVIALLEAFLASMLLGIYVLGYKVGSNPFLLMRDVLDAPIFQRPDYLRFIEDGSGLNPLLQNYWMVIHPPTLFFGFALTAVPFAFTIAALWKGDFKQWIEPVLPWALAAGLVLGTGILMGGAWAYEALSFGGFWAWDPVENASLVPWLVLIAGLHTLLVYKHTGQALKATFLFFILSFIFVLYSTFLTRSGILGDASVHSFTDLGMSGQLIIYLLAFALPAITLLAYRWRTIPVNEKEERLSSREFWMFIGSLLLFLSGIQITFTTSIPVYNKVLGTNLAPPTDPISHYNSIQIWFAIIIVVMTGFIQYLRYGKTPLKTFLKRMVIPLTGAAILTALILLYMQPVLFPDIKIRISDQSYLLKFISPYALLAFAAAFAITGNLGYLIATTGKKLRFAGASITHTGFALILIGILVSGHNKQVISINTQGIDFGDAFDNKNKLENVLLKRNMPLKMGPYYVTYLGDSVVEPNIYYKVRFEKTDGDEITETFYLYPNAQINPDMGLIANPATKRYLEKDIYTHVTSVPDKTEEAEEPEFENVVVALKDSFFTSQAVVIFEGFNPQPDPKRFEEQPADLAAGVKFRILDGKGNTYHAEPIYIIVGNRAEFIEDTVEPLGLTLRVEKIIPESESVLVSFAEKQPADDFIILKVIEFPWMNVLWLGCLVMGAGFVISILNRRLDNQRMLKRS